MYSRHTIRRTESRLSAPRGVCYIVQCLQMDLPTPTLWKGAHRAARASTVHDSQHGMLHPYVIGRGSALLLLFPCGCCAKLLYHN